MVNESQTSHAEPQEKRTWQTPAIEELDFRSTEAAYIPGAPIDLGFYTA